MANKTPAEQVVEVEVARQREFGMEPSWVDFAIVGMEKGRQMAFKEVGEFVEKASYPHELGMLVLKWYEEEKK